MPIGSVGAVYTSTPSHLPDSTFRFEGLVPRLLLSGNSHRGEGWKKCGRSANTQNSVPHIFGTTPQTFSSVEFSHAKYEARPDYTI